MSDPLAPPAPTSSTPAGPPEERVAPTRVVVVDDHAGVRAAIARMLAPVADVELVGFASDGDEATRLCREVAPDVVLMDLAMPRVGGVEATRRILAERPCTRIVVFTSASGCEVQQAFQAGAVSCVLKHEPEGAVVAALRSAAAVPRG